MSLRLEIANQLLAGLYATRVVPHELSVDSLGPVLARLREASDDVHPGASVRITRAHLPAPTTLAHSGSGLIRAVQQIRLEINDGAGQETALIGTLRYDARPAAEVTDDESALRVYLDTQQGNDTAAFEVSDDSPIQLRDAEAAQIFDAFLSNAIWLQLQVKAVPPILAPRVSLPFDRGVDARITAVRTGTSATAEGDGSLHLGIAVGIGADPIPPSALPDQVEPASDVFGRTPVNLVSTIHEATLQAVTTAAIPSLQAKASAIPGLDVRVKTTTVQLRPPEGIRLVVDAYAKHFCPLGVELDFTGTVDARPTVHDGRIAVLTDDVDIDLDNSDVIVCTITSLIYFCCRASDRSGCSP